jgi:hypothetical protein
MEQLLKEKRAADIAREIEMECLVETPAVSGPPKNQQDITHFFAKETALERKALERKKLEDSQRQRQKKGLNWYSKLKKSPEELKIIREDLRRQLERKRKEDTAN